MTRMPSYFISHGGGPWPWVENMRTTFAALEASFKRLPGELPERPKAVLMISGHWEEQDAFTVMHAPAPPMLYDYYNFPPHTYEITYPAPGAPALAERTAGLIAAAGLPSRLDDARGFDHGTFVPMAILWPDADMPLFQVSMRANYAPAEHFALGRALAPLRDDGVLIIGSGLSYHNLRAFGPAAKAPSMAFDGWLNDTLALPAPARTTALEGWESAPYARQCHAREDHLVPLFAALGAAEDAPATRIYHEDDIYGGVTASSWRFD
ncbi:DODA-type extradiol aromatic ring-opening family dioxygenase [Aquicoccus sp. G2-2]|uniref:DODA-type extradiol aromatic ring-opening family dioxygenase n=1 Tax=Aquicoccus sp. G2-2 TaxID=3092120 RepID=UPI002AE047CF|nr:class III extradiol ring-cleavage dioxygenase [Aquicoccus sp. G2-2]MEA1114997.1 class III extradiol ring-cleavage dioxygenase [Aquicoccus sp. G2-2]